MHDDDDEYKFIITDPGVRVLAIFVVAVILIVVAVILIVLIPAVIMLVLFMIMIVAAAVFVYFVYGYCKMYIWYRTQLFKNWWNYKKQKRLLTKQRKPRK